MPAQSQASGSSRPAARTDHTVVIDPRFLKCLPEISKSGVFAREWIDIDSGGCCSARQGAKFSSSDIDHAGGQSGVASALRFVLPPGVSPGVAGASTLENCGKQIYQGKCARLFGYVLGARDQNGKVTILGVAAPGFVTMIAQKTGVRDVWSLVTSRTDQNRFFAEESRDCLQKVREHLIGGIEVVGLFLASKEFLQPKVPILMRLCEGIENPIFVLVNPKKLESAAAIQESDVEIQVRNNNSKFSIFDERSCGLFLFQFND